MLPSSVALNPGSFGLFRFQFKVKAGDIIWNGSLYRDTGEAFSPRTELGKRLWEIRKSAIAANEHLLGWDEVERELIDRRGGPDVGEP